MPPTNDMINPIPPAASFKVGTDHNPISEETAKVADQESAKLTSGSGLVKVLRSATSADASPTDRAISYFKKAVSSMASAGRENIKARGGYTEAGDIVVNKSMEFTSALRERGDAPMSGREFRQLLNILHSFDDKVGRSQTAAVKGGRGQLSGVNSVWQGWDGQLKGVADPTKSTEQSDPEQDMMLDAGRSARYSRRLSMGPREGAAGNRASVASRGSGRSDTPNYQSSSVEPRRGSGGSDTSTYQSSSAPQRRSSGGSDTSTYQSSSAPQRRSSGGSDTPSDYVEHNPRQPAAPPPLPTRPASGGTVSRTASETSEYTPMGGTAAPPEGEHVYDAVTTTPPPLPTRPASGGTVSRTASETSEYTPMGGTAAPPEGEHVYDAVTTPPSTRPTANKGEQGYRRQQQGDQSFLLSGKPDQSPPTAGEGEAVYSVVGDPLPSATDPGQYVAPSDPGYADPGNQTANRPQAAATPPQASAEPSLSATAPGEYVEISPDSDAAPQAAANQPKTTEETARPSPFKRLAARMSMRRRGTSKKNVAQVDLKQEPVKAKAVKAEKAEKRNIGGKISKDMISLPATHPKGPTITYAEKGSAKKE